VVGKLFDLDFQCADKNSHPKLPTSIFYLAYFSTLKMEATHPSETSVDFPENRIPRQVSVYNLHSFRGRNLLTCLLLFRG
jgi:hypothetical protein